MISIGWFESRDVQSFKMEDVESSGDESIENEKESSTEEESDNQEQNGNPRLADALAKAIHMGNCKNGKSIILSKAKLYKPNVETKKTTHGFEIVPDPSVEIKKEEEEVDMKPKIDDIKPSKKELKKFKITKQEKLQRGRLKPSPLDREKERPLLKIATKGVVQLFNAVRQQQSAINKQINKPGLTEGKKEKILKSINKKAFLDVLMGKTREEKESESNLTVSNTTQDEMKSEPEEEEPSWKVLRDDFMMGAKLKDWDKKEIEVMEE